MMPCQVEITGIAGALQIYGCGTALFLFDDASGQLIILRVHNCLYGHGEFNLLSVSQICQKEGNAVDFALESPELILRAKKRSTRIPLFLDLAITPELWIFKYLILGSAYLLITLLVPSVE